jgi:hypothetical protein
MFKWLKEKLFGKKQVNTAPPITNHITPLVTTLPDYRNSLTDYIYTGPQNAGPMLTRIDNHSGFYYIDNRFLAPYPLTYEMVFKEPYQGNTKKSKLNLPDWF